MRILVAFLALTLTLASCSGSDAGSGSEPDVSATPSSAVQATAAPTTGALAQERPCTGPVSAVETFEYLEVDGVDPNLLSLDVYSPAVSEGCPAIFWVHGGSWQAGDKATNAVPVKADLFVPKGYVFVSINYRLAAADNDVRWPTFGADVAAAAAWIVDHAEELGVDAERVGLLGHSSGAHLVSAVATNPALLDPFGLTRDRFPCVVSLDTDLYDLDTPQQMERALVKTAFGDDVEVLIDGSPFDQVVEHADDGPFPEFLIVTRGTAGRIERTTAFADVLADAGALVELVDVNPYDHRDANVRLGEPGEAVLTPLVTSFFDRCLA